MRIAVAGAGVGGLAAAVRLAHAGHAVTVFEQSAMPGGKAGRVERDGFVFDSGPSLLTMPWVLRDLFAETGAPLETEIELLPVEPVTRYAFADGSGFDMSADLPRAVEALEAWSPGAGADWRRFMAVCESMWLASQPFLTGPPPWPPRRPVAGAAPPDPRDFLRVRPWQTLAGLARSVTSDLRLRMVIERFATYAGADPRRAPAALAVAGYVEHAWGAWHVHGGIYAIVEALVRRLEALGGELRCGAAVRRPVVRDGRVAGVETDTGFFAADRVLWNGDASRGRRAGNRSLSGFALMLGLRGAERELPHHTILFPGDYAAEFDDVFTRRVPVREPTLYLSAASASDPSAAPEGGENVFVLVNAPTHEHGVDWDSLAAAYEEHVLDRLAAQGYDFRERIVVRVRRTPADLERETGAVGGAIYGAAPHGRFGTLKRPPNEVRGIRGLYRVGGTTHPGGGLPLVMLSGKIVADAIGGA